MGKHLHKLTERDLVNRTAICAVDGPVELMVYGNTYRCIAAYRETQKALKRDRKGTLRSMKTDTCAKCGFVAQDLCQMDLDHINGDRSDHRPENMQTLCATCHRLKSLRPALW